MLGGILALLAGLWGGLLRLGWNLPHPGPHLPLAHGPLMVGGFLGTVIALERAVAIRRSWAYLSPAVTAAGAIVLVAGGPGLWGPALLSSGSLLLVVLYVVLLLRRPSGFLATMALGAAFWFAGNVAWLSGWPVSRGVFFWASFLVLTIAGERLELHRLLRPGPWGRPAFALAIALVSAGAAWTAFDWSAGNRLLGAGLLALASWLAVHDVARRTVRRDGATRFTALALLSGYFWLGLAGGLLVLRPVQPYLPDYDAVLHAIFLGFVMSMIFGHAPIILPAVLRRPVPWHPIMYGHLALLHASLLLRVAADLRSWWSAWFWSGTFNVVAVALFLVASAAAIVAGKTPASSRKKGGFAWNR